MIRHIVLWKLHEHAEGCDAKANAERIKQRLFALADAIPAIKSIEVGLSVSPEEGASEVAFVTTFDSLHDLETYASHPAHREFVAFITPLRNSRAVIDYEF